MTSLCPLLSAHLPLLLLLLLLASVVEATLNLTLQYEIREDRPPGSVIGKCRTLPQHLIYNKLLLSC